MTLLLIVFNHVGIATGVVQFEIWFIRRLTTGVLTPLIPIGSKIHLILHVSPQTMVLRPQLLRLTKPLRLPYKLIVKLLFRRLLVLVRKIDVLLRLIDLNSRSPGVADTLRISLRRLIRLGCPLLLDQELIEILRLVWDLRNVLNLLMGPARALVREPEGCRIHLDVIDAWHSRLNS